MDIAVELEERTKDVGGIIQASYFLVVHRNGDRQEILLGKALKDSTFQDGHRTADIHGERRHLVGELSMDYSPPTPTLLQYFSIKPLEDVIIDGERANIHPVDEMSILRKFIERLTAIDASVLNGTPRHVVRIGNRDVDAHLQMKISTVYQHFFPYARVA